jgi:hypothetical protein
LFINGYLNWTTSGFLPKFCPSMTRPTPKIKKWPPAQFFYHFFLSGQCRTAVSCVAINFVNVCALAYHCYTRGEGAG